MDLGGKPLLWHVLERVKRSKCLDRVVLATTTKPEDDVLVEIARGCEVETFRGAENDLVDRYYQAARSYAAGIVVRICADNPVLEPLEIDRIVEYHERGESHFSSNLQNIDDNGYPDGIGAEVLDFSTLEELWTITSEPRHREHPHSYFYEHRDRYCIGTVQCPPAFRRPELKLDVNTPEELRFIRAVYEYWYPKNPHFHITDVIWWYDHMWQQDGRDSRSHLTGTSLESTG